MSDEPTDINKARLKRIPQQQYVDMQFDEPQLWLQQIVDDGTPVPGVTGVHFGLDGAPGAIINAAQCRAFAIALLQVAEALDEQAVSERTQ